MLIDYSTKYNIIYLLIIQWNWPFYSIECGMSDYYEVVVIPIRKPFFN